MAQDADGGSWPLIGVENFPFELALATNGTKPDFAVNRSKQPYAELTWSVDGNETIVTSTGSVSLSPKLGWLADGSKFLVADQQGLSDCSDRPVVMRCIGGECSSRCLALTNAGTVSSVVGGVVLAVSSSGFSLFNISSATFDGGSRGVSADRVFSLDAGNTDQLALSPDGQRAVALAGFPDRRLLFFSPASDSPVVETQPGQCEPRVLLSSPGHAFYFCRARDGEAIVARVLVFNWNGELEQTIELGDDREARYLAPHGDQLLVGTGFDGGIEVKRVF